MTRATVVPVLSSPSLPFEERSLSFWPSTVVVDSMRMLSWPLVYAFPPSGMLIWLVAVIVLAAGASYLPARGATRLTVRDVLAYE